MEWPQKIIHKDFSSIRVIALTSYNTKSFINNMINVGCQIYLVKNLCNHMIKTVNEGTKGFLIMKPLWKYPSKYDFVATSRTVLDE